MSWKATAYVKELRIAPNGEKLTQTEKLLLFVLADCHNADLKLAWPSIPTLADLSLTSEGHTKRVLHSLAEKRVIAIVKPERQGRGRVNGYRFCQLDPEPKAPTESEVKAKESITSCTPLSPAERGTEGSHMEPKRGTEGSSWRHRNKEELRTKIKSEPKTWNELNHEERIAAAHYYRREHKPIPAHMREYLETSGAVT